MSRRSNDPKHKSSNRQSSERSFATELYSVQKSRVKVSLMHTGSWWISAAAAGDLMSFQSLYGYAECCSNCVVPHIDRANIANAMLLCSSVTYVGANTAQSRPALCIKDCCCLMHSRSRFAEAASSMRVMKGIPWRQPRICNSSHLAEDTCSMLCSRETIGARQILERISMPSGRMWTKFRAPLRWALFHACLVPRLPTTGSSTLGRHPRCWWYCGAIVRTRFIVSDSPCILVHSDVGRVSVLHHRHPPDDGAVKKTMAIPQKGELRHGSQGRKPSSS